MTSDLPSALPEGQAWSRLDVRMLLVHPVTTVVQFLPALIGIYLIGSSGDGPWWRELVVVAIPVAVGVSRYFTTRYRLYDGRLELRHGLITKKTVTARIERIRTVEMAASPIHRLLGLAKVKISTAHTDRGDGLVLDSLPRRRAAMLRAELLHASRDMAGEDTPGGDAPREDVPGGGAPREDARRGDTAGRSTGDSVAAGRVGGGQRGADDQVLLQLDPRWVRYAPLTAAGVTAAAAIAAVTARFTGAITQWAVDRAEESSLAHMPTALVVATTVVGALIVVSLLAMAGYVLSYWRFMLSRDRRGRSLHISRGLATTRETSIEMARVRGAVLHEPWALRMARAARLSAIVTGISRKEGGAAPLVPPAPRASSVGVCGVVLSTSAPMLDPLQSHGPRATVRRFTRAGAASAVLVAAWAVLVWSQGWDWSLVLFALVVPALAALLAMDRAQRLGHAVVDGYVVSRAHSIRGRRVALASEGIIGWTVSQSFFQRRAGLVTLTATTAAGAQGYSIMDVPEQAAADVIDAATPELGQQLRRFTGPSAAPQAG